MIGLGTVFNAAGIVIGGIVGIIIGKGLKQRFQDILMTVLGISIIFMSISGALKEILVISNNQITTQGTYMIIISLVLGALIGELINIEARIIQFGEWIKKKTNNKKDTLFVDGFVTASLTVCVGAMAVIGSINDGLSGDYSILLTKAILDSVIILVMTTSLGKGCVFSVIPVVLFQGTITLTAKLILPVMTAQAISNLSLVGSILIFCVGVNLAFDKRIKVANLLPAIVFAVLYAFLPWA